MADEDQGGPPGSLQDIPGIANEDQWGLLDELQDHPGMSDEDQMDLPDEPPISLQDLPHIPLMNIAAFLSGPDLLNFTHASKGIFDICEATNNIWVKRLSDDKIPHCPEIAAVAKTMVDNHLSKTDNVDKLTYFMHRRTIHNWKKGYFRRVANIPRGVRVMSAPMWVNIEGMNTTLSVWDIVHEKLIQYKGTLNLTDPAMFLYRMHWTGSILITVFVKNYPITRINMFALELGQGEEPQLKEKWRVAKTQDQGNCDFVWGSQILVVVYSKPETMPGHPFTFEGLRFCDGSTLFSFTIARDYSSYPRPTIQGPWVAICSTLNGQPSQLQVINCEKNSVRMFAHPEGLTYLGQTFICHEKHLIGCYFENVVSIWDLQTGQVVKEVKLPGYFFVGNFILVSHCTTNLDMVILDKFTINDTVPKLIHLKGDDQVVVEFPKFPTQNKGFVTHQAFFFKHLVQVVVQTNRIKKHNEYRYSVRVYNLNKPEELNVYILFESTRPHYVAFMTPTLLGMTDEATVYVFDFLNTKLYDKF